MVGHIASLGRSSDLTSASPPQIHVLPCLCPALLLLSMPLSAPPRPPTVAPLSAPWRAPQPLHSHIWPCALSATECHVYRRRRAEEAKAERQKGTEGTCWRAVAIESIAAKHKLGCLGLVSAMRRRGALGPSERRQRREPGSNDGRPCSRRSPRQRAGERLWRAQERRAPGAPVQAAQLAARSHLVVPPAVAHRRHVAPLQSGAQRGRGDVGGIAACRWRPRCAHGPHPPPRLSADTS